MTELLQVTVSASTVALAAVVGLRLLLAAADARRRKSFVLTFPRTFTAKDALAVVNGLSGLLPSAWQRWLHLPAVVLEARADARGIRHLVHVPAGFAPYVASQLWASGVRLAEASTAPASVDVARELSRVAPEVPLATDDATAIAAGMLAALQPLSGGESVCVQWVVAPARRGLLPIAAAPGPASWWQRLLGTPANQPSLVAAAKDWQSEAAFLAAVRVGASADTVGRRKQLVSQVLASFHRTREAAPSFRTRAVPNDLAAARLARGAQPILHWPCLLRASELSAALALPIDGPVLPGLALGGCRLLAPGAEVPSRGRVVGESNFPGLTRTVAVGLPEAATRHLLVHGPTGSGKSTVLLQAVLADVASGAGVCVVDPKAELCEAVADRLPAHRVRDVIWLRPDDADRPVGFNLLAGAGDNPELVVDGLVAIFRELARGSWGPRLEDVLRSGLLTLARDPAMTLCELEPLLVDSGFRSRVLARINDPLGLEPFWAAYEELSDAERGQWVGPVLNKVRSFTVRRPVRRVIGQSQSSFRLPDVLARGKILLVSLPKGTLGDDSARLLGAAVVGQLWQAVLGRAAVAPGKRRPFFVYVDEWQDFVALPTSIGTALAQSRGMAVGWTLAGQHLHQVSRELREDVLANAVNKICFGLSATDAHVFAREFAPYLSPEDLQGLGSYEAVFRPAASGSVAAPLTMRTLPAAAETGTAGAAREHSRGSYGRDGSAVDAELRARRNGTDARGNLKRRRRR